ncbi:TonB-dependent receptor [Wielerella bovis]|uniref:TonB-dependent receptor n=1 Tax=Wielerella bovis TaxID=2917790 RepID=UPI0020194745|nr:TonB-dependent receptor [Wielerella bovis]ULJ61287.1 TonB-dependent siderophore receptor [Wielerella bovis]
MKLKYLPLALFSLSVGIASAETTPHQQELQNVVVKRVRALSKASDGNLRDTANLGLLGKVHAFQVPITIVNYDEKYLNDSQQRTLVDAIAKKDASTWQFGGESNTLTGLYFRGYQLDARQFSVNGLAGIYGTQGTASVHIGSAQLIKGASTAVTGMDPEGAVSGAVNMETKKASNKGNRKISTAWFSDSRGQVAADLGQRFGERKEWGVRVNGLMRAGDTPREGYDENNKEFSVNADYCGERLRASVDSIYAKRKTHGGRARIQDIQNAQGRLFDAPSGDVNLAPSWQAQNTRSQTNMATFEYDATDNVQITGGIGYNDARYEGNFASPTASKSGLTYQSGRARLTDQRFKTLSMNLAARGDFDLESVSNSWNVAYDRIIRKRLTYQGARQTTAATINPALDIPSQLAALDSNVGTAWNPNPSIHSKVVVDSLALANTFGVMDNQYRLTLGGRYQMIKQNNYAKQTSVDASRFSPMAMTAWVPNPNLTVYANYMEDLEPGAVATDITTGDTTMADPRVSRQFEIGVRKNWGDIVTTLNAFQITRPGYWRGSNALNTDYARLAATGSVYAGKEQGKERNRGIELNAYANLMNGTLRPNFGLMYLQSRVHDYPNYADNLVNGVQVANPRIIAKAGVEWDTPYVNGLTLNTSISHFGKSYQDTQKQYAFPSYTLVDVGAKYGLKLKNNQNVTISGAVENVFNKAYWQVQRGQYDRSFAVVGMPRTFWLKADWSF